MSLKRGSAAAVLSTLAVLLVGCTEEQATESQTEGTHAQSPVQQAEEPLYENDKHALSILSTEDWALETNKASGNLYIVLSTGKLNAIISSVSLDKSFEEISGELIKRAGSVTVLTEQEAFLSYQSTVKNPVRTDVYFREHNDELNILIIFMSPSSVFEDHQPQVESLLSNITFD